MTGALIIKEVVQQGRVHELIPPPNETMAIKTKDVSVDNAFSKALELMVSENV